FGQRFYAFNGPDEIVCVFNESGGAKLGRIDLNTGRLQQIELLYTTLHNVQVADGKAVMYASSATLAERVLVVDLETLAQEVVKVANPTHIEPGYFSVPSPTEFRTAGGSRGCGAWSRSTTASMQHATSSRRARWTPTASPSRAARPAASPSCSR